MLVLAALLVTVTTADGGKVYINPAFVTKLYPTKEAAQGKPNELVVGGTRCVVTMSDGKFLSVREPCDYVLQMIEGKPSRRP
jgi:uncharacterized protein YlzI (FlbEa/FlbD family)